MRGGEATTVAGRWLRALSGGAYGTDVDDPRFLDRFCRSDYLRALTSFGSLDPGMLAIETGIGSGKFSWCLLRRGLRVLALDIAAGLLSDLRRRIAQREPRLLGGLDLLQGDLESLPLKEGVADLIFSEGVLEHWLDDERRRRVLATLVRALKPGAHLVVLVPNGAHPLHPWWRERHPAFLSSPPMIAYTPRRLLDDLAGAGLVDLRADGVYPWRTVDYHPSYRPLRLLGGLLQRVVPTTRAFRLRFGLALVAVGRRGAPGP